MEITHNLKRDHRIIEQAVRALDGICLTLARNEAVPSAVLSGVFEFFVAFAEHFHRGKEEKHLLPVLKEEALLPEDASIESIVHEHAGELEIVNKLGIAIEIYQKEPSPESTLSLVAAARAYCDMLVGHFEKEDKVLFRLVEEMLDDTAKRRLAEAFKREEAELGPENYRRYEKLARELEREWAF